MNSEKIFLNINKYRNTENTYSSHTLHRMLRLKLHFKNLCQNK